MRPKRSDRMLDPPSLLVKRYRAKVAGHNVDQSPRLVPRLRISGNVPPFPPTRLYGVHRAGLPLPLWMWEESLKAYVFLEVEGERIPQDNQCPGLDSNSCRLTPGSVPGWSLWDLWWKKSHQNTGLCPSISVFTFRCHSTFAAQCLC